MKTVYADVVFFENFIVDYILLYLSIGSMYIRVKPIRIVISAIVLSMYSVAVNIVPMGQIVLIIMSLFMLICASALTLGKRSVKVYIRFCITMYAFSFLLFGFVESAPAINGNVSCLVMLFLLMIFVLFFKKVPEKILLKCDARRITTEIILGENIYSFLMVCDSGNLLIDPKSKLPVIIVGEHASDIINGCEKWPVPYKTMSGDGVLWVVMPDRVRVNNNGKWHMVSAVVGLSEDLKEQINSADGILPSRLLENL